MQFHPTKIYFASDQHFGAPTQKKFSARAKFCCLAQTKLKDAEAIFWGDLFDFGLNTKPLFLKVYACF
jgi:UDP-2,3-diacylglucosamine hydrolase